MKHAVETSNEIFIGASKIVQVLLLHVIFN